MERVYNFAAGPAVLPEEVLKKAADEMFTCGDKGMSVMEMSHRSDMFLEIIRGAESLLRELMDIPDKYKVLFLQGGASMQFAMVPMNLFKKGKADYVNTGQFATKAIQQAAKLGSVNVVASSEDKVFNYIPELDKNAFTKDADYFHITTNNTIFGTRYTEFPDTGSVPLVADMSSNILSEYVSVEKFGLIYAGAQKNLGPSGLCVVIIREDLIGPTPDSVPIMMKYETHAKEESLYNTPPTYCVYILKLVLEWLKSKGGIPGIQKINESKAALLYDYLDKSSLFKSTVAKKDRSLMNVPFVTGNKETDRDFVEKAEKAGLVTLAGHRSVGGMRASIYNAMPVAGIQKLIDFMAEYEKSVRK